MKKIVIDLDGTITVESDLSYSEKLPNYEVVERLREYKRLGFLICIFTSRGMRTSGNNIGVININNLPIILEWLGRHNIPFDEVVVGKPWCGFDGFYVDDKAIRPSEFAKYTYEEIKYIVGSEK